MYGYVAMCAQKTNKFSLAHMSSTSYWLAPTRMLKWGSLSMRTAHTRSMHTKRDQNVVDMEMLTENWLKFEHRTNIESSSSECLGFSNVPMVAPWSYK